MAAIDRGLARNAGAQPPAGFAAGVRLRLAEERVKQSAPAGWAPGGRMWAPALAFAALVLLGLALWRMTRTRHTAPQRPQLASRSAPSRTGAPPAKEQATVAAGPALSAESRRTAGARHPQRLESSHPARPIPASRLQVLAQPGEWAAMISLYRESQSGRANAGLFAGPSKPAENSLSLQPIEIKPLDTAELEPPKPLSEATEEGGTH